MSTALLPCQQAFLATRHTFPDGTRLYQCESQLAACVVSGSGPDEPVLVETCRRLCGGEGKL